MILTLEAPSVHPELQALQALGPLSVAPTLILPDLEVEFYQLANLPEQLEWTFQGIFGARLDEEALVEACRKAQRLIRESYLLPERIDALWAHLAPGSWLVRYAGEPPFALAPHPQEALLAIKRLWASRWSLEAVLERAPRLAPPEAPTLLQRVSTLPELNPQRSLEAEAILGRPVRLWESEGQIVRVELV
jgi:hypothetical protein